MGTSSVCHFKTPASTAPSATPTGGSSGFSTYDSGSTDTSFSSSDSTGDVYGGGAAGLLGAAHATIYPYGPFPAGDGKIVMLGLQNEREWSVFCDKVLQNAALVA